MRGNSGDANYHSLQLQVNRRYIRGVQFGAAYTLQRARGLADEDPGNLSIRAQPAADCFYYELAQSQTHNLGDQLHLGLPGASHGRAPRSLLDGWQLSGRTPASAATGRRSTFTTADNFDFTGGDGGQATDLGGGFRVVRPTSSAIRWPAAAIR